MKESVDKSALFKSGYQYPGYIFFSKLQNRGWLWTIAKKFSPAYHHLIVYKFVFFKLGPDVFPLMCRN